MMGAEAPVFIREEDLLLEMQIALRVSKFLPDIIEPNTGTYLGKDITPLEVVYSSFNILEFKEEILGFLKIIDSVLIEYYSNKAKQAKELKKPKQKIENGTN